MREQDLDRNVEEQEEDVVDTEVDGATMDDSGYYDEQVEEQEEQDEVVEEEKKASSTTKKPEIKKKKASGGLGFLKNKKVLIGIGVVAVLVLLVVVKNVVGGNKSFNQDYFSVLDTILNSDGGQFAYTITVHSGEHTDSGLDDKDFVNEDDLQNLEVGTEESTETVVEETNTPTTTPSSNEDSILESTDEADSQKTLSAQTSEWGTQDGIALTEWKYPNYTLKINGSCTSTDPYTAQINLVLATENFSDNFTDIVAIDGTYYINVAQMKYWLENSKDSYLVSLSNEMPDGSKYVQINPSDFNIASRYAEDGEKNLSGVNSMYAYKKQFLAMFSLVENTVKGYCELGSNSKDGYLMSAQGENGASVASAIKSIVTKSGDFYDSYISNLGEMSDDAKKQKDREKDNFISAMQKAMLYMNLTTTDAMNFQMNGNAVTLTNGDNNQQYEATLNIGYTLNDTDYVVSIRAQRIGSKGEEITAPDSSVSESLMSLDEILGVFNNVTDYFNFTDIEMGKQLEPTPANSVIKVLQDFVDLVNESNCYSGVLSIHNVMDFLQKYSNIEERNADGEEEKACIILTNDFLNTFGTMISDSRKQIVTDDITGEKTDKNSNEVIDENQGVEQYPTIETTVDGVDLTMKVDTKESNSRLLVVKVNAINNSDKNVTLDETNFQVKTLLSSVYPANNRTLLGGYDSEWYEKYEKKITTDFEIKAGEKAKSTLYFVISDDNGYMDIWYNDTNLGVVVQY